MNKHKRKVITMRVKLVKKMATQLQPFDNDVKNKLNAWYTENSVTPLKAKSLISVMKNSKLHKFFFIFRENNQDLAIHNTWGNIFSIKFPMCLFCRSVGSKENMEESYYATVNTCI